MLTPRNPDFRDRVRAIFEAAAFVQHLGIEMTALEPGVCEAALGLRPEHLQQDGVVHAGVIATLADHTAGAAAGSLIAAEDGILSVEFNVHLLRAGRGERLRCRAEVVKAGRTISVAESRVFAEAGGAERLIATATVTLAILPPRPAS